MKKALKSRLTAEIQSETGGPLLSGDVPVAVQVAESAEGPGASFGLDDFADESAEVRVLWASEDAVLVRVQDGELPVEDSPVRILVGVVLVGGSVRLRLRLRLRVGVTGPLQLLAEDLDKIAVKRGPLHVSAAWKIRFQDQGTTIKIGQSFLEPKRRRKI